MPSHHKKRLKLNKSPEMLADDCRTIAQILFLSFPLTPTQARLAFLYFGHVERGAEFLFKGMPLKYYLVVGESEVQRVCFDFGLERR